MFIGAIFVAETAPVLQMMVLFSSALRSTCVKAKLQALEGWLQLLVALAAHAPSHLKTVANQVRKVTLKAVQCNARLRSRMSSAVHTGSSVEAHLIETM